MFARKLPYLPRSLFNPHSLDESAGLDRDVSKRPRSFLLLLSVKNEITRWQQAKLDVSTIREPINPSQLLNILENSSGVVSGADVRLEDSFLRLILYSNHLPLEYHSISLVFFYLT